MKVKTNNSLVSENIHYAAITAMFAALITVTTAFIKIPAPLGYVHAGDSMIYLAASILPEPLGFAAAAIGGGLADLLAGYPQWAIPTAIIKALNVLPFFLIKRILKNSSKRKEYKQCSCRKAAGDHVCCSIHQFPYDPYRDEDRRVLTDRFQKGEQIGNADLSSEMPAAKLQNAMNHSDHALSPPFSIHPRLASEASHSLR